MAACVYSGSLSSSARLVGTGASRKKIHNTSPQRSMLLPKRRCLQHGPASRRARGSKASP
jgi:hypothetical protein